MTPDLCPECEGVLGGCALLEGTARPGCPAPHRPPAPGLLDRLASLAAEATSPGPWRYLGERVGYYENGGWNSVARVLTFEGPDPDGEFIAAADPDTVAALVEVARAATELCERGHRVGGQKYVVYVEAQERLAAALSAMERLGGR